MTILVDEEADGFADVIVGFGNEHVPSFKELRDQLLNGRALWGRNERADRDSGAHLLVHLDQPLRVLDLGVEYLVATLGAARGDAGILTPISRWYQPSVAVGGDLPNEAVATTLLDNHHPMLRRAWAEPRPLAVDSLSSSSHLGSVGRSLRDLGTTALMATSVQMDNHDVALLCVDEVEGARSWDMPAIERMHAFVTTYLAPVLVSSLMCARQLQRATLTAAQLDAVRLLAEGQSYRQVARQLGKSERTIDNQLRAARRRVGANNSIELIRHASRAGWL